MILIDKKKFIKFVSDSFALFYENTCTPLKKVEVRATLGQFAVDDDVPVRSHGTLIVHRGGFRMAFSGVILPLFFCYFVFLLFFLLWETVYAYECVCVAWQRLLVLGFRRERYTSISIHIKPST